STMVKAYALGIPLVVAAPASVQSFARALGFEHVSELSVEAMAKSMRSVLASPRPGSHFDVASTREFALGLIGRDAAFGR
ncbi:hypothetical protein PAJ90_09400, partial [Campylobacter coli]|uniref:hypothetical protein n=1 Tax=Campylobacter coli TaxID=195 RepID=UPI0025AF16C5